MTVWQTCCPQGQLAILTSFADKSQILESMHEQVVYIRWGPNRNRADDVARGFGAELVVLRWQTKDWFRTPLRYAVQFVQTLGLLLWRRPRVVFSQHTQPFCSLAALAYAKLTGSVLVTDCHNGPFVDRLWLRWPLGWINRRIYAGARLNLVHNESIRQYAVRTLGLPGEFQVLRDGIPAGKSGESAGGEAHSPTDEQYVLVICSFSADEPIEALVEAAAQTPEVQYRLTGHASRLNRNLRERIGANVRLMGFIPDDEYDALVRRSAAAVALSVREHVLTRACHEVMAAHRPLVTSDNPPAREYLSGGTVFVENTASSIAEGIRRALRQKEELAAEMADLERRRTAEWFDRVAEIRKMLGLDEH